MTDRKLRYTPEQERGRAQAFAQRDGFATGFVRGWFARNGGVDEVALEQGRKEAKGRYPIFASQRRIVEDGTGTQYMLSECRRFIRMKLLLEDQWRDTSPDGFGITPDRVLKFAGVLSEPDEIVQTDE